MASLDNVSPAHNQSFLFSQMPLLDLFFPGLGPVTSPAWSLLTGGPSIYSRALCIVGLLLLFGNKSARATIVSTPNRPTVSKIEVPYTDEAYDMLIFWVCSQPFAQSARTSLAKIDLKSSAEPGSHAEKKPLHYSPCNGRSYFWHKGRLFVFNRQRTLGDFGGTREEASLSYFGRNPAVLRELFNECRRFYLESVENKTCVFEHQLDRWKASRSMAKREMSTVIINRKLKEMLLGDVTEFLDPKTRAWYSKRGLPYQRGYLLHGPPGTGKSSLCLSIAGHFDLDVYVLTLSSLNDHSLKTLFAELPQHCIVLLEDVDATAVHRKPDGSADPSQSVGPDGSTDKKVSLSTLLNVLDGLASSQGRLLIMTTNHIERLDPALIRPGRVDMKVELYLADEDMINQLFFFVYNHPSKTNIRDDESGRIIPQPGEGAVDDCELLHLGQEFVAKVPKLEFSPAKILSFLLANKHSPRHAIANVVAWMEKLKEEKAKLTRITSWALDDNDGFGDH
ncbi:P-loop containing nucleoside triphosphate hydrolase protein [Bimuria novae-zelandiae CBS 107.79]|uniref:P-loop containing nucleoside triphosphate hydrolase protein n=1 Tax=Bimuria novae-zelandiae CBS 107.79 TaxID=1447943 RepID=A0A6A5VHG2_9PLEO|nr:P-loop containing nucleoside triphosphate hydrolase protein [Bimuria novae-zelandiae CBS 107.79]